MSAEATVNIPFLSLKRQHVSLEGELKEAAKRVIESGIYVNGPENAAFASELAASLGLGHVATVSNGLDAIRLILRGYMESGRLREGDEVILPANTYIATLLPVVEFRLKPVLAKPDCATFGLDWREALNLVSDKTKAVISVHLYGTPSWDFEIAEELRKKGILLIEDNAQAIGAQILDSRSGEFLYTGTLGDAAAFSFYPTKNIGALGDAGAVATADGELASTVKALANYGSRERYRNEYTGYNCRMDEIQAAFLRVKLKALDSITSGRNKVAMLYDSHIVNPEVDRPLFIPGTVQVWHQYVIRHPRRNEMKKYLADRGIATDVHYPRSLFDQECFSNSNLLEDDPGCAAWLSRKIANEVLSLPIADVTEEEVKIIADLINSFS